MACPPLPPCQMPSLYPAASRERGGKGWLHPRDGDCGARLMAEMVDPSTGSTHSCSHHFGLLRAQSVSAQGIPPWDASGCGEAVQEQPASPARHCMGSSQEVGWCAVSQTTWGFGRRKIPNFSWPPIFIFLKSLSRRKRFKAIISLFRYSELDIMAKMRDGKQPGRRRCNEVQQELRLIMPIHWWTKFWCFSHIK